MTKKDVQAKYQSLVKRFSEYNLEPEQLVAKLNEILSLAIESTEERINPKMNEPVQVKVRNLAVANKCVNDLIAFRDKMLMMADDGEVEAEVTYELIQGWVDESEGWDDNVITSDGESDAT